MRFLLRQMGFDQLDDPDSDILEIFLEATAGILASILVLVIAYWVVSRLASRAKICYSFQPDQCSKVYILDIKKV